MKVRFRARTVRDLDGIFDWIAADNPPVAAAAVRRIHDRIALLATPGLAHMAIPVAMRGLASFLLRPISSFTKSTRTATRSSCLRSCTARKDATEGRLS